ncbi:alpha/beta fold hydrolase [Cellulomonas sp. HZM]|uniref:alpha/beta fold hydrolase n=1 Tax=Cellulomonas sp. HZM TaxID=1454010 RepID=UPI0018CC5DD7|nr:alpha/beta fold hydrolase [Cellulomonas sp. HZM]
MAALERQVSVSSRREADEVVAGFWAGVARTPLVERLDGTDELVVTFLWRDGDADQVLLFVNRLTDERDLAASLMRRVPGTDVWHLSYRMGPSWRASYAFLPHRSGEREPWRDASDQVAIRAALDHGCADPLNPEVSRNRAGVAQSVAALPSAPAQSWLRRRPGAARGTVREATEPGGRRVWLYEPPGLRAGERVPLVVALDGEVWTGPQDLPATLDALLDDGAIRPLCAVLVDSGGRENRWAELDQRADLRDHLATDLLDWARSVLPVGPDRSDVTVVGQSLGALTALWALVRHPDRIGSVVSQSASLWQDEILTALPSADLAGTRAWVEVGRQEWVLQPRHPAAVGLLRDAGCDVAYTEFDGGHDYACWRGGIADALRHLHPNG